VSKDLWHAYPVSNAQTQRISLSFRLCQFCNDQRHLDNQSKLLFDSPIRYAAFGSVPQQAQPMNQQCKRNHFGMEMAL
jgi:hypothetical protein